MKVLHLGCGTDVRSGWLNVDSWARPGDAPAGVHLVDLRQELPWLDGEFDAVYSSHFLEHLTSEEAHDLLVRCRRVLKPGGVSRHCLPDSMLPIRAIIEGRQDYFDYVDKTAPQFLPAEALRSPIDYVSQQAYGWSHKCLYDLPKAKKLLETSGYVNVSEAVFDPAFDLADPVRRYFSLYVEGFRPAN
jgi:predicted SAM-dependent methyltransferase